MYYYDENFLKLIKILKIEIEIEIEIEQTVGLVRPKLIAP
jgi:hypothetical protein